MHPRAMLEGAALELRGAEAALRGIVGELRDAGLWSGSDAERFAQVWEERVSLRLRGAAATLDAAGYLLWTP